MNNVWEARQDEPGVVGFYPGKIQFPKSLGRGLDEKDGEVEAQNRCQGRSSDRDSKHNPWG